tara:strand:+ start:76 stop:927 length:852 start_codon:yes stop_codon:yes gene_type:complete
VRNIYKLLFITLISFSFSPGDNPFELVGHIQSEEGIILPNIYIQVWKNGDVINQTKTDNFGNYTLPLSKIGVFTIIAGNKNKYFHPNTAKDFDFHTITRFKKDFKLKIDKQILQRETTKLRESYNHMMKNRKNLSYRRAFFKQFPESGYETELFFNKSIPYTNLKKEAKIYLNVIFNKRVAGWAGYMNKFIRYGQKTNMSVAGPMTKKFYAEAAQIIKEHPLELYKELSTCKDKRVRKFFIWMFSGKKFGKKEPDPIFDFLSGKFNKEFVLMHDAFDTHLNGE